MYFVLRFMACVFPARAGMNRPRMLRTTSATGVPRPRGDEPLAAPGVSDLIGCSPPARG